FGGAHALKTSAVEKDAGIVPGTLLEGVGGNRQLLRKLAKLFLADLPKSIARIKAALDSRDQDGLAKAAHALKGSVGNFGAAQAAAAAADIEKSGRCGEFAAAREAWKRLESELSVVKEVLAKLAAQGPTRRAGKKQG